MMISPHPRPFFLILVSILLVAHTYSENDRQTYIVYLGDQPKDIKSTELHHMSMVQNVLGSDFSPEVLLHSYKKSFNGFVVKLREEEAERMARMDSVVSIFRSKKNKLQTTRSWDFLGFTQQVKRTSVESDVIVGVIDSGIWPESDSFSDKGFGPPPSKWKGACHNFTCNNKIVGAKYFRIGGQYGKDDIISPRDSNGHGTHTSSTVAGNLVNVASLFGLGSGTARGGVPSARIAMYKVCWSVEDDSCDEVDILAAFDEAIADGVDIISLSVNWQNTALNYFEDAIAIGAFHAMKKGILTSNSAGNFGPNLNTMTTLAPWLLSVAASTIDRKFFTKVQLGNGMVFEGVSVNTFDSKNKTYPLIYAGDAANITGGFNSSISRLCLQNSLDEKLVKGKIVLCDDFPGPLDWGLASGAAGVVFGSTFPKDVAYAFATPATLLSVNDALLIYSYINSTTNPTATIFRSNEGKDSLAPYIADFSSRGPNPFTPDILKPDIAAPGVDILAAWSPINPVSEVKGDGRVTNYNIISGTSMACPHATASAAYIKSFHPEWSPAAIKSALMTTATPMNAALNPEAELAYGAGQINPIKAVNPGLVYDASEIDYVKFLCGQGYGTKKLRTITEDDSSCTQANNGTVWDLNHPSFAVFTNISSSIRRTFHRTVTNVGSATSTYKAKVIAPASLLNIQVSPDVLSFTSLGQKKSFALIIEGQINVEIVSASLIWEDGSFQVRSPIVIHNQSP